MQRRTFLHNSMALLSLFPLTRLHSFKTFNAPIVTDDVVKFSIGKWNCTVLRDSMFKYLAKDFFINAEAQELNSALNRYNITPDNIPSPFIALLLEQDNKKILIDTGAGFTTKPIMVKGNPVMLKGKLLALLEQQGRRGEDITDVLVTHFHPDHIGGIFSEEATLQFPNAQFHLHEDEWNYWHSSSSANQPDLFRHFVANNITKLKDYNLHLIKGDFTEVLPGITAVKAMGHTPGQIVLIIQSAKEQLLYASDAFLHPLHISHTDWQTNYDLDHAQAKASRIKLLELAYKDNMLVNAFHFDFPGMGRIDKHKDNWIWNKQAI